MMLAAPLLLLIAMSVVRAEKTALLVVDVQDCFLDAAGTNSGSPGSLAVLDTTSIIPIINRLRDSCLFDLIVRSQTSIRRIISLFGPTHGVAPFAHLAGKGELPLLCVNPSSGLEADASCCPTYHIDPYDCTTKLCPNVTNMGDALVQEVTRSPACTVCRDTPEECFETTQAMWTNHCLQQGDSVFPPSLVTAPGDIVVQKGRNLFADSYSAFMDNTRKIRTPLEGLLKDNGVTTIYIVGIALDYCVYFSTLDALTLGFDVKVIEDATRGISPEGMAAAIRDMTAKGAEIVKSRTVMETACKSGSASVLKVMGWTGLISLTVGVLLI